MDPYQLFFPLGLLSAVAGTVIWIAFGLGWSTRYPGTIHPDLMVGGFMVAFAAGFLMTAIPRFTGTERCRRGELAAVAALFTAGLALSPLPERWPFHAVLLLTLLSLIAFCVRRFRAAELEAPPHFAFVGAGLGLGAGGGALVLFGELGIAGASWAAIGRLAYLQGMMLALVVGVGSQLLPALLGWTNGPLQISPAGRRPDSRGGARRRSLALAAVFALSFGLEGAVSPPAGRVLRALLITAIAVRQWRVLRRPRTRGQLPFWLWCSAGSLTLGLWVSALWPRYWVHGLHLTFIGGFGLMILMIASRVSLAHGGYGLALETRSRLLPVVSVLILLAAATRAIAILTGGAYLHHLAYAGLAWVAAVVLWAGAFLPRIWRIAGRTSRPVLREGMGH